MFEIFRMDIRRMCKDKKFYTILICVFVVIFLFRLICAPSAIPFLNMLTGDVKSNLNNIGELARMPQIEFLQTIMHSGFLSLLCCIYMGLFVCADFEFGFYKHIFSIHTKEIKYILSKIIFSATLALIICLTAEFSAIIISYLPAFKLPASSMMDSIVLLVQEWAVMTGFCTLILFFSVVIKNKAIVGIGIIAGSGLLIYIVSMLANSINRPEIEITILKYSLFGVGNNCLAIYNRESFWMTLGVSLMWIVIYTILSTFVLKRRF